MIEAVDELMKRWAVEIHGPDSEHLRGAACNPLARLIANRGVMISSSRGGGDPCSVSADIELIVNKHLPPPLQRLALVHYTDHDSPDSMKWERCGCSRAQYYRRLSLLHSTLAAMLITRRRAA